LRAPGVTIEVEAGTPAMAGDAALLRFALTTLIHRCEAAALDRGETPDIRLRARPEELAVQIHVMSGAAVSGVALGKAPDFGGDAEASAVNAVLVQHDGAFVTPRGEVAATHFTLQFDAL
jgi:hypothetical protein